MSEWKLHQAPFLVSGIPYAGPELVSPELGCRRPSTPVFQGQGLSCVQGPWTVGPQDRALLLLAAAQGYRSWGGRVESVVRGALCEGTPKSGPGPAKGQGAGRALISAPPVKGLLAPLCDGNMTADAEPSPAWPRVLVLLLVCVALCLSWL